MELIRDDKPILVPGYGLANFYRIFKGTKYSIYVPYYSLLIQERVLSATIAYFQAGGFGQMGLEEFLSRTF